jgi:hypothetical protein
MAMNGNSPDSRPYSVGVVAPGPVLLCRWIFVDPFGPRECTRHVFQRLVGEAHLHKNETTTPMALSGGALDLGRYGNTAGSMARASTTADIVSAIAEVHRGDILDVLVGGQ